MSLKICSAWSSEEVSYSAPHAAILVIVQSICENQLLLSLLLQVGRDSHLANVQTICRRDPSRPSRRDSTKSHSESLSAVLPFRSPFDLLFLE